MSNYDNQRAERDFMMNPPTNAPGQGDDGWNEIFGDSNVDANVNNFTGADTDVNSILNGQQNVNGSVPIQNNIPQSTFGDKIGSKLDEATVKGAEGIWNYMKYLVTSLTNNTRKDWNILGTRICLISSIVFVISVILLILSIFVSSLRDSIDLTIGSSVSLLIGVILVGFNRKNSRDEIVTTEEDVNISEVTNNSSFESVFSGNDEDIEESPYNLDDDDDESYDSLFSQNNSFSMGSVNDSFFASNDSFDVEETINNLGNVSSGQYTRQYLFETFSKVLPTIRPNFRVMEDIDEDSDEFYMFEDYLRRSAEQTGISEDKLEELQLLQVRKNLFIIQILATRPTGLKEKDIADGIADCYMRDDFGMIIEGREGVFARVDSQVGRLIIDIFLCNNVMVSLGDVFRDKKDFMIDTKNIMPLIWGISEMGTVYCYDGMKDGNGGMLISGEARSGKSWKVQSLIAQMSMFMSPKELEFYFYDVKGQASDYAYISKVLPHCKGFCGEALKFNSSIESLLKVESERRTNLLGGKYTNVKDYNKDHPFDKIPTTYIVIDEMATAMSEMTNKDKEIRKYFDSLLIQIATKYPYLELKLLVLPHRIVNDIINKTVSSMISTRAVLGNVPSDELKSALDIKNFPYSLVNTGDMAIKTKSLNSGNAVYSHSEVLSADESTNRKIFDFIGAVWGKLEPDCRGIGDIFNKKESVGKNTKVAKDNSVYSDDFDISNNYSSSEDENESFWDDVLKNEESDSSDESKDFWSNF